MRFNHHIFRLLTISFISLTLISTTLCFCLWGCEVKQPTQHISRPIFGMWVWHLKYIRDQNEQDGLIQFCQQHGINRVLMQIHFEPYTAELGHPKLRHPKGLRRFLDQANRAGIAVEALDGQPGMGLDKKRSEALAKLDAILAFNKDLPGNARFSGVHYDIEPYTLPQWNTPQRDEIMRQYLEFHDTARSKVHRHSPVMTLAASIPFWYDHKTTDKDRCVLEYDGQVKNFHQHIQDVTDYVAIMSYRCEAEGDDSISSHVQSEVDYAQRINRFACAGMETIQLNDTPDITFYGLPPKRFWSQKERVDELFEGYDGFGGVMVHDYQGFRRLLETPLARMN